MIVFSSSRIARLRFLSKQRLNAALAHRRLEPSVSTCFFGCRRRGSQNHPRHGHPTGRCLPDPHNPHGPQTLARHLLLGLSLRGVLQVAPQRKEA